MNNITHLLSGEHKTVISFGKEVRSRFHLDFGIWRNEANSMANKFTSQMEFIKFGRRCFRNPVVGSLSFQNRLYPLKMKSKVPFV